MKCPFNEEDDFDCPYVDTSGMDKEMECNECPFNGEYVDRENEFMMGL